MYFLYAIGESDNLRFINRLKECNKTCPDESVI